VARTRSNVAVDLIANAAMLARPEAASATVDPTVPAVVVARPRRAAAVDRTASVVMLAKPKAVIVNVATIALAVDAALASRRTKKNIARKARKRTAV